MPKSDFDFTFKFFHPPQRTVPFRNGLLDTRTKHIIAQDRLVVAEQRILDAERRKSASNLQLLAFEQKQLQKKLTSIYSNLNSTIFDRPVKMRDRSTSEVIFHNIRRTNSWTGTLPIHHAKLSISLHNSNQNLLSLPKIDDIQRRFSAYSDGDIPENPFNLDLESGEEGQHSRSNPKIPFLKKTTKKKKIIPKVVNKPTKPLLPIFAFTPPEEEVLFLTQ